MGKGNIVLVIHNSSGFVTRHVYMNLFHWLCFSCEILEVSVELMFGSVFSAILSLWISCQVSLPDTKSLLLSRESRVIPNHWLKRRCLVLKFCV